MQEFNMPAEKAAQRKTPVYEILSEADIEKIVDVTFALTAGVGAGPS